MYVGSHAPNNLAMFWQIVSLYIPLLVGCQPAWPTRAQTEKSLKDNLSGNPTGQNSMDFHTPLTHYIIRTHDTVTGPRQRRRCGLAHP